MARFLAFLTAFFWFPLAVQAQVPAPEPENAHQAASIWAHWLPDPVTPSKLRIHQFNDMITWVIGFIVLVVAVALFYTMWRFRKRRNPVPSGTTHNLTLEIIWTLIPCLILLAIVVPSLRLMYFTDVTARPDLTLKVTGYQWYWGYSYPDQEIEEFSLNYVPSADTDKKGEFKALRALPTYQRFAVHL